MAAKERVALMCCHHGPDLLTAPGPGLWGVARLKIKLKTRLESDDRLGYLGLHSHCKTN